MPSVTNLKLAPQTGASNTYYATWDFKETITKKVTSTTTNGIVTGDWVTITSGATYYNGVSIPSWVLNDTWKVIQVSGDRAVLGTNKSGTYNICSPISTNYLSGGSSSSGGSTTTEETTNYLDHYTVTWYYATGDGVWFQASESDVKIKQSTYSAPSNAYRVKVTVQPVSQTHEVNEEEVSYWTGTPVSVDYYMAGDPPETPDAPTVTIKKYQLTASLENISDSKTDRIKFEIYSGTTRVNTGIVNVETRRATYTCNITAGRDYRVRCVAINDGAAGYQYSSWSDFSSSIGTAPNAPQYIFSLVALSETSVQLSWKKSANATSYEIQYTTKKIYFDSGSSEVSSQTVDAVDAVDSITIKASAIVTGLETGQEYFFRVRAINDEGESGWSEIKSISLGKAPAAPTTWSSTTTAIVGESLLLYWVHNAEDNSSETFAELEMYVDGVQETHTIENTASDDDKDKTKYYEVDTSSYSEGATIKWRVRTAGVTKTYGDWSVQRTVDIYAPATLDLNVVDAEGQSISLITSFPFYISAISGPATQLPIGYQVSIVSDGIYTTVDNVGDPKIVTAGEAVYSKYFDKSTELMLELSANNIDLANNQSYTVKCTVSMNSGLRTEATAQFNVEWAELTYEPDAEIGIDTDTYSAYISPYCIDDESGSPISDVLLSVYRKEFDGTYTEIADGIDTASNTYIVDPHPSLDYARYRIVATSVSSGAVSYYDPPGYPVKGKAVIIQWDDEWSNFDAQTGGELENPPWTGSMLKLPYNIDVSDSNTPDVALVTYIGREYPVTYYGTQIGSTSSWSVEVPKDDKDTLYALRRLARWMGDVYVREPSGSGYWANVTVSFSQKHCELTIPVSLSITRVEGGI
jgi:hypothetical protein